MNRISVILVLFILSFFTLATAQEMRIEGIKVHKFSKRYEAEYKLELRNDRDIEAKNVYSFLSTSFSAKLNKEFAVSAGLRYGGGLTQNERIKSSVDYSTFRWVGDLKYKFDNSGDWRSQFRLRYQHVLESNDDPDRFLRGRLSVKREVTKQAKIGLFYEYYLNLKSRLNEKHRLGGATTFRINGADLKVYLMNELKFTGKKLKANQIIGIEYKF